MRNLYETFETATACRAIQDRMSSRETDPPQAGEKPLAPLPAHYAFVVQLGRESDPALGRFVGQIEHLTSGRQGRFSSQQEMFAFLESALAQTMAAPPDERER